MRLGIVIDHAGFTIEQELLKDLRAAGHDIVDYGASVWTRRMTTRI